MAEQAETLRRDGRTVMFVVLEETAAGLLAVADRRLSGVTMSNIRHNLFSAFFYNVLGVPVGASVRCPFFGPLAVAADRQRRDEPQLGFGYCERFAAAKNQAVVT